MTDNFDSAFDQDEEQATMPSASAADGESPQPEVWLTQLTVKNFKKVGFARLNPTSWEPFVIGGENEQGKSTLIDAVLALLLGKDACPVQPIKLGKNKAEIQGYLGDDAQPIQYVVKRKFSAAGGTTLTVDRADGEKLGMGAQEFLTSIAGKSKDAIAFDPLLLTRMSAKEQDAFMRKITGVDMVAQDAKRKQLFDERALVNKEHERAKHEAERLPHHADAPGRELVVTELVAELESRQGVKARNDAKRDMLAAEVSAIEAQESQLKAKNSQIVELEEQLARLNAERDNFAIGLESRKELLPAMESEAAALVDPDIDGARKDIADAEAVNQKVRANASRLEALQRADRIGDRSEDLTEKIKAVDAAKAAILENAKYPIDGLGFDDIGPTFNGLPLSQASQAQLVKIGVAIGVALRPRLRLLLVRYGADLDKKSRAALWEMAQKHKCHVWLEVVTESTEGNSITMHDGSVVGAEE
jgi:hypothetical protein